MVREIKEIEIAQLNLRYAHTRIERPKESLALAASIERIGQIVPVIVTRTFVLLDGYLRVKAIEAPAGATRSWRRSGTARKKRPSWRSSPGAMAENGISSRRRPSLKELHDRHHLSQEKDRLHGGAHAELGLRQAGALPRPLRRYYRAHPERVLSTWTATRVIVPIARAIPEHGKALSENLSKTSLSTREMALFFRHYQKANRRQRENMVRDPALFLKSLHAREEALEAKGAERGTRGHMAQGPEDHRPHAHGAHAAGSRALP